MTEAPSSSGRNVRSVEYPCERLLTRFEPSLLFMLTPFCQSSSLRGIALTLLLALTLGAGAAHAGSGLPAEVVLPWTPVRALLPDYCGPASLSNVLRYWGRPADQLEIGRAVFDRQRRATLAGDLILRARQAGLEAVSRSARRDDLTRWLAAGIPVVVLQDLSPQDRRGHFRVVVG